MEPEYEFLKIKLSFTITMTPDNALRNTKHHFNFHNNPVR